MCGVVVMQPPGRVGNMHKSSHVLLMVVVLAMMSKLCVPSESRFEDQFQRVFAQEITTVEEFDEDDSSALMFMDESEPGAEDGKESFLSYTIRIISPQSYEPFNAKAVLLNPKEKNCPRCIDGCRTIKNPELLQGRVVFYSNNYCDGTKILGKIKKAGAVAAVELFGSNQKKEPNDQPPRYAFSPHKQNLTRDSVDEGGMPVIRVYGKNPAKILSERFQCKAEGSTPNKCTMESADRELNVRISAATDVWYQSFLKPGFIIYKICAVTIFVVSIPIYSIMALCFMKRRAAERDGAGVHRRYNIQQIMFWLFIVLGFVHFCDQLLSNLRDYGQIWVPEMATQLAFIYVFVIAICSFSLLILYWADIVNSTRMNVVMIGTPSQKKLAIWVTLLFCAATIAASLWSYKVPNYALIRSISLGLGGLIACMLTFTTMYFGGRIIRQLNKAKHLKIENKINGYSKTGSFSHNEGSNARRVSIISRFSSKLNPMSHDRTSTRGGDAATAVVATVPEDGESPNPSSPESPSLSPSPPAKKQGDDGSARAKPLTRLVFGCALIFIAFAVVAAAAGFSGLLENPDTFYVLFILQMILQASMYFLVLNALSPMRQEARLRHRERKREARRAAGGVNDQQVPTSLELSS